MRNRTSHFRTIFIYRISSEFQVSAITAIYVILLSVLLPLTGCSFLLSHILQFWTAIVILAKMIYQLRLVDTSNWLSNCTVSNLLSHILCDPTECSATDWLQFPFITHTPVLDSNSYIDQDDIPTGWLIPVTGCLIVR